MVNWRERIAIDLEVLGVKQVVKGTRLAVEFVLGLLAEGWTEQQLLANYPASPPMTSAPAWPTRPSL